MLTASRAISPFPWPGCLTLAKRLADQRVSFNLLKQDQQAGQHLLTAPKTLLFHRKSLQWAWKDFVAGAKPTKTIKAIKYTQGFTPATKPRLPFRTLRVIYVDNYIINYVDQSTAVVLLGVRLGGRWILRGVLRAKQRYKPNYFQRIKAGSLYGALRVRFTPSTLCGACRAAFFAGSGGFGRQNKLPHKVEGQGVLPLGRG